jgi:hypothetical protein
MVYNKELDIHPIDSRQKNLEKLLTSVKLIKNIKPLSWKKSIIL